LTKDKDIKKGKISSRTLEKVNAAIQIEFHDIRVTQTQTEPIFIQMDKEQHAIVTKIAAQIENVHFL